MPVLRDWALVHRAVVVTASDAANAATNEMRKFIPESPLQNDAGCSRALAAAFWPHFAATHPPISLLSAWR
jgi:hypothetical protein